MINPWPYSPASFAPGWPGIPPRWTSSAKSGVGTALTAMSRVWFTLSHGILNEIYYRRPDEACIRDLGLIVIDDQGFFSEEKRHADHQIRSLANGVPAYELVKNPSFSSPIRSCTGTSNPSKNTWLESTAWRPILWMTRTSTRERSRSV